MNRAASKSQRPPYLTETLEKARALAMESEFLPAIHLIDAVLEANVNDTEALRLKGNVLEQQVLEMFEVTAQKLLSIPGYIHARECYERILQLDPNNTLAHIDLGDHFRNLDAYDKALQYYRLAYSLLAAGEYRVNWEDEVSDLGDRGRECAKRMATADVGNQLLADCEQLLEKFARR